jgi:arylsulfatase A-like enzyme
MPPAPNIIVLMADTVTTGAIGCYGSPFVRTPHIDALAQDSALFERAYQPATMCQPSRLSWMTGCYPATHGVYYNGFNNYRRGRPTLLSALRAAGYHGGYLGIFHCWQELDRDGMDDWSWVDWVHDFPCAGKTSWRVSEQERERFGRHIADMDFMLTDEHLKDWHHHAGYTDFPIEKHIGSRLTDKALACIDDFSADRPNLLWTSYWMPHEPWAPPAPWHEMYRSEDVVLPANVGVRGEGRPPHQYDHHMASDFQELWGSDGQLLRRALAAYAGCMSFTDHCIGRVIARLKDKGLYDDSLVIFLTDHGTANGAHGLMFKTGPTMIDEISRVPLLVKLPGQRVARRISDIVASVDLFPTIMELVGASAGHIDGRSLMDVLGGGRRTDAFALGQHDPGTDERGDAVRSLRRGRWKYSLYSKAGVEELYDMDEDPLELRNLAAIAGPERAALRDELIGRIRGSGDSFIVR